MFFNAIAMRASNFRGLFNLLVAWLLGPAALGMFSIAWAVTDILSKVGIFGLDNAITTFIARSEAAGDRERSRTLFRLAGALALAQSAVIAVASIFAIRLLGGRLRLQPEMVSAIAIVLCAMPGVALYRISIAVSQGMKVMQHDIYSREITEPIVTALAFLIALAIGFKTFGPELALIVGTAASGVVAFTLASKLFRHVPVGRGAVSLRSELRQLLNYAAPISAHQLLTTFIAQLDLIILGCFIGRTPGVTLVTVGIYGAVVGTANGLRKITQVFNPIFAPVAAGMTAAGDHELAAATYARLSQRHLRSRRRLQGHRTKTRLHQGARRDGHLDFTRRAECAGRVSRICRTGFLQSGSALGQLGGFAAHGSSGTRARLARH